MQKLLSFFQQKNISVFGYKVVKHLMSLPLNELVKLKICFEQPGPGLFVCSVNFVNLQHKNKSR